VHASREEKKVMNQKTVYEELKRIDYQFPKYHIKILLRDFNPKVGRGNNSKPTTGNGSLHQESKDNIFRSANFATSKNLVVKARQVIRMREKMCMHGFGRETRRKETTWRPRRREEDNIKTELQVVFFGGHGLD
jgi:hypothetical protein